MRAADGVDLSQICKYHIIIKLRSFVPRSQVALYMGLNICLVFTAIVSTQVAFIPAFVLIALLLFRNSAPQAAENCLGMEATTWPVSGNPSYRELSHCDRVSRWNRGKRVNAPLVEPIVARCDSIRCSYIITPV
jgi:hypothetical protein